MTDELDMEIIRIHFIRNGEHHEGEISQDVYDNKIFPILRDHLKPVEEKQLYTLEQAERELKLMGKIPIKKNGWFH